MRKRDIGIGSRAGRTFMLLCMSAVFSVAMYGCGSRGSSPGTPPPPDTSQADLAAAKTAAMEAATAAGTAADAAERAVMDQEANKAADPASHAVAKEAATLARAASDAAAVANTAAQAATAVAAAEAQRDIARMKKLEAEAERDKAMQYAGMVAEAQRLLDEAAAEARALADAKDAAMGAAVAARTAATDARAAADKVAELLGAGSVTAMAADAAADAAEAAARAAEEAAVRAQDDEASADAMAEQRTAEDKKTEAEMKLADARELQRQAQAAHDAAARQQEEQDIAAARDAAEQYKVEAQGHYESAMGKAAMARERAAAARAAANKAMRARTDYPNADRYADVAEMAADEAEAERDAAKTAAEAAAAAYMAAMAAMTSDEAEAERDKAMAANEAATANHTGEMGAGPKYMAAEAAAAKAEAYAGTHVLGLFAAANAQDVTEPVGDDPTTDADESMTVAEAKAAEVESIGSAMAAAAAANHGDQIGAGNTFAAAWAADTPDDPNRDGDQSAEGMLQVTSTIGGGAAIVSDTVGTDANGDGDFEDAGDTAPNARKIDGIGAFLHGFNVSSGGTRVLAFTDRMQATAAVTAVTGITLDNVEADAAKIDKLGTKSGNAYTGVEYDDDGDANTPAVMGTLTCPSSPSSAPCSLTISGDTVTEIEGYRFTGSRAAVEGRDADPNDDYLLFGIWLNEAAADGADTFGAFGVGGPGHAFTAGNVDALEGTATYEGKAVGAHHKTGVGINWFDADAMLTAKFGDETEGGTIEGTINNIRVNGSEAMEDPIYLVETTIAAGANAFDGNAVMGMQSGAGQATHDFNGTWSGGFFGDGEEVTEHPMSVAGTFGVTRETGTGDDAVTESYVGAFGAHKQ